MSNPSSPPVTSSPTSAPILPERLVYSLLLAAIATMAMGQTLVFSLLPLLGRAVGLRELQIGIIITASSAVYAVATRAWGRHSDRLGRKYVILIGLTGYTVGTLVFTSLFWLGFEQLLRGTFLWLALILARCLQSSVMAGTMPASNAYVSDITSLENRTTGIARLGAANSTGTIIGPAMGGMLAGISLLAPLYFAAFMTFSSLLLIWIFLPESPRPLVQPHHASPARLRFIDKRYGHFLLIAMVMFTAFSMVIQTLGFYFQDTLQLSSQLAAKKVGFALMLSAGLSLLAQGLLVQHLRWPAWRLIHTGLFFLIAGSVLLAVGGTAFFLFAGVACCGLGIGLSYPGCVAAASLTVGADEQGALAGLTTALPAIGSIIGPVLGTGLYEISPHWPYAGNLFLLLPVFVYALRQARLHRR
ncbi:MAG: MFS transporter [bacterium]|nr:MFS transporter [bacterium]